MFDWNKLLEEAILIAVKAHKGTIDKGGSLYILHPLRVMHNVNTMEEKIVAVLHDVIEDTEITYDMLISKGFPNQIIEALKSVTRNKDESYMNFIKRAKLNPIGRVVKLNDLNDNLNLSRIENPRKEDYDRLKKYEKAKKELLT